MSDVSRGMRVLAEARARHEAMSPQRRALADVAADVFRLVVVATTYEHADRALGAAGLSRALWRHVSGPEGLRGHAPGTPLLWLGDPLSFDGDGRVVAMRDVVESKRFVEVGLDDVADVLGHR